MGEVPVDYLEERRGYVDVTWREVGVVIRSCGEEYCGETIKFIA